MAKNFLDQHGLETLITKIKGDLAGKENTISTLSKSKGGTGNSTGTATYITTDADTSNTLYVTGVTSSATTTLKRDTSVTVKGDTVTATTFKGALNGNADTATTSTTATTATKLSNTSAIGDSTTPVYFTKNGVPTACSLAASGNFKSGIVTLSATGVLEIGPYIDFHSSTTSTVDYDARISYNSNSPTKLEITDRGYIPHLGTSSNANSSSTTKPVYVTDGKITAGSTYAGGTKVTLNGSDKGASTASFYAPTDATASSNKGYTVSSNGSGAPVWKQRVYWGSSAPSSVSGYLPGDIYVVI